MESIHPIKQRNFGIDALRIVSMMMVVFLHVLGQGGILSATESLGAKHNIAWLLEIAAYCAVNCYALISGYVGLNSKFKYSSIITLWLQVVFYTVLITLGFKFLTSEAISTRQLLGSIFPVVSRQYWYFTAYFCMFFFMPALNGAVHNLERKQLRAMLWAAFALFCVMSFVAKKFEQSDVFLLKNGYSALWLAYLYLIGGYIKKYNPFSSVRLWKWFALYAASVVATFGIYIASKRIGLGNIGGTLVNYNSPTILLCSIALLFAFAGLKTHKASEKIIAFLAPLSFSVYLIHTNPLIWNHWFKNRFVSFADFAMPKYILWIFGTVLVIFLACALLDVIRHYLFKWLKVKNWFRFLDQSDKREKLC